MMRIGWAATAVAAMMTCAGVGGARADTLEYSGTIVDAEIKSSPIGNVPLDIIGDEFHYYSNGYLVVPPFGHYDTFFDNSYYSDGTFSVFQYGVQGVQGLEPTVSINGDDLIIYLPEAGVVHGDFTGQSSISFDLKIEAISPVPLPASLPLFSAALLVLGGVSYGRVTRHIRRSV